MSLFTLTAALLLQTVSADFSGNLAAVSSDASVLAGSVAGWNSGAGLQGALGIQAYFPTLESAVKALSQGAGSISNSDIKPDEINSFVGGVVKLLDDLTSKASEFAAVGAGTIVKNDLEALGSPAADVIGSLAKAVGSDCQKIPDLTSALAQIAGGFKSANAAYSANDVSFTTLPSCDGKAGAASSAAAGSSAPAKTSGAAAAASSAAPKATSVAAAHNGTGNATVTNTKVATETEDCGCTEVAKPTASAKATTSLPAIANGASLAKVGVPVAAVAAIGLLM